MSTSKRITWGGLVAAAALALFLTAGPLPASGPSGSGTRYLPMPGERSSAPRQMPAGHGSVTQSIPSQVFTYIDAFYVDPKRVHALQLVTGAFRSLETQHAEVVIDVAGDKRSATVHARGFDRTFDLSRVEITADAARVIDEVTDFVADRLGADAERDKLVYLAVNGALRELDPHTNVFSMKHFKDFKTSTSGSFGGIGFTFNVQDGEITIISPIPDTPAARAGLQSGDRILYIDGVPTTNMSSDMAVGRMRGEPGTPVTLTVAREGWPEPHDFPIVREIIKIVSVESRYLDGGEGAPVVYARVKNFQTDTSGELARAIRKLERPGTAGVILDLRDNPGGLLEEAVKLADGFLDEGAIVSTRNRTGRGKVESARAGDTPFTRLPLVVLTNRGSASASEIVSAALQDRRALLVGERTFGKGSVQQAFPLSDGGGTLVTVAQYLTPGDVSIQSIGVEPDVALEPVLVSPERVQLAAIKDHVAEASLENAFSDWGNARREAVASVRFLRTDVRDHGAKPGEPRREPSEEEKTSKIAGEFEVRLARRILGAAKGAPGAATRAGLLAKAREVLATASAEEEKRIAAALAERGVDWAAGPAAAPASLSAKLPQEQTLKAGEKAVLTVAVTNTGAAPLHRVWGRTDSANPLLRNLDFAFGTLAPGQTREATATLEVPGAVEARWDTVSLKLSAGAVEVATATGGSLQTATRPAPEYSYRYTLKDENPEDATRSGDGRLEQGERARVTVEVTNRGGAASPLVEANLSPDEKEELYMEEARTKIQALAPGTTQSARFSFKVVRPQDGGGVKVGVSFSDRAAGGFFADEIEIPTATAYRAGDARVPPQLAFQEQPPLVTDAAEATLRLSATDDGAVKDVVVYRGDKKLTYRRNAGGGASFPVSVTVPLEGGSNRIVIVARDDKDIPSQKVVYVHRRGGESGETASAGEKGAHP